jgi:hypothetical protein
MGSIINRFEAIAQATRGCSFVIAACLGLAGAHASAQATGSTTSAPPAASTYKGCVQKAPGSEGTLIISTTNVCAKLTGKVSADSLPGHEVELQGILTPRTPSAAASIQVNSVTSVGSACRNVCSLRPPGTRGLHKPEDGAVPGTEGGTPGAAPPQPGPHN